MGPGRMRIKRGMDILLSLMGMAVCSPLFLLVAAVMAVHWRGCPFFCQERVGRGGRIFRIYKFRTMPDDAEARGPQLTAAPTRGSHRWSVLCAAVIWMNFRNSGTY